MSSEEISCKDLWASISDYIDGELNEEFRKKIEEHMCDCEHCRVVVDTTSKTIYLYRCETQETQLPDDVRGRLLETLQLEDYLKPKPS